jgi:DNA replication protein DnaC
MLLDIF